MLKCLLSENMTCVYADETALQRKDRWKIRSALIEILNMLAWDMFGFQIYMNSSIHKTKFYVLKIIFVDMRTCKRNDMVSDWQSNFAQANQIHMLVSVTKVGWKDVISL